MGVVSGIGFPDLRTRRGLIGELETAVGMSAE